MMQYDMETAFDNMTHNILINHCWVDIAYPLKDKLVDVLWITRPTEYRNVIAHDFEEVL